MNQILPEWSLSCCYFKTWTRQCFKRFFFSFLQMTLRRKERHFEVCVPVSTTSDQVSSVKNTLASLVFIEGQKLAERRSHERMAELERERERERGYGTFSTGAVFREFLYWAGNCRRNRTQFWLGLIDRDRSLENRHHLESLMPERSWCHRVVIKIMTPPPPNY